MTKQFVNDRKLFLSPDDDDDDDDDHDDNEAVYPQ